MAQVINSNIMSLNAQRNLNRSAGSLETALQRLSSGLRINSAKDDAAGLAISERFSTQIRGLTQAVRNANDGISLAQTAEGALNETSNILQRIRELSVQSANATNSASDRAALNSEVQQLLSEAQRISTATQFNGQNILDGTFTGAQFQIGANAKQTILVNVGNAQTSSIGSYQASGASAVSAGALASGNLTINGVDVGVSTSGSAEAKATAINAVASQTGVTATASTELASTNALRRNQTLQAGDLVINGVNVGSVAGSNNVVTQGANIATAINAVSNQTGVTATSSQATGALTLTSTTGKDIVVESTTGAAGAQRLANASGLVTVSGTPTASTNTVTFANGILATNTITGQVAAAADSFDGNVFTINGVGFEFDSTAGNTGDLLGSGNYAVKLAGASTAAETVTEIRGALVAAKAAGATGLANITIGNVAGNDVVITADVMTTSIATLAAGTAVGGGLTQNNTVGAGAAVGDTLNVGGVTYEFGFAGGTPSSGNVLVALGATDNGLRDNFIAAVEAQYTAGNTNIRADLNGGNARLTSDLLGSGVANVTVTEPVSTGTANAVVGGAASAGTDGTATGQTGRGTLELNSGTAFLIGGTNPNLAGLGAATVGLTAVNTIDISTVAGANAAIALADGALSQVSRMRADLGAVQNRFDSTISNLSTAVENLSASRSRILDADFAAETAQLTRAQILQQAGVAMLAQANAVPQNVLALLR